MWGWWLIFLALLTVVPCLDRRTRTLAWLWVRQWRRRPRRLQYVSEDDDEEGVPELKML